MPESAPLLREDGGGRDRLWLGTLGALVALRCLIPLAALAFSGHALPGLPAYRYQPLNGDSFVYYADAREFIASFLRVSRPLFLFAALLVAAAIVIGVICWRRQPQRRAFAILVPAAAVSAALTLPIHQMQIEGGGTIGWPMLWAIPLFPIRALGFDPRPDIAFGFGLALLLAAMAIAVVGTAYVGLYATGRRSVGLIAAALLTVETENIARFGFGAKAFGLSLIETALLVSHHEISGEAIAQLLGKAKAIVDQPVELLDDVQTAVEELSTRWPLVLITKGDLVHQEAKVMASGLAEHFRGVEIVNHKDVVTYRRILDRYGARAEEIVMVGNSVQSDILPVLEIGGHAVLVPHEHGWAYEHAEVPVHNRLRVVERFADVLDSLLGWKH